MTAPSLTADMRPRYRVEERHGWCYVVDEEYGTWSGPWRYRADAQQEADELNTEPPQ